MDLIFYSPQTFLDNKGRRIMAGWMSRMEEEQNNAVLLESLVIYTV